jgi:hypothetical protein
MTPTAYPTNQIQEYNFSCLFEEQKKYDEALAEAKQKKEEQKLNDFKMLCKEHQEKFDELKIQYTNIFEHPGIKRDDDAFCLNRHSVQQDENLVTRSDSNLFTQNLNVCMAIIARGTSANDSFHGLSHYSGFIDAKDELNNLKDKMIEQGCKPETIEFYLVGGKLPYLDIETIVTTTGLDVYETFCEGSLHLLQDCLSLSNDFNIVGAQFNVAKDNETISVLLKENEIIWITDVSDESESISQQDTSSDTSEDVSSIEEIIDPFKKRKHEGKCEDCIKKNRIENHLSQK